MSSDGSQLGPDQDASVSPPRIRIRPLALGALLIAAFYSLDMTTNTLRVMFRAPWDRSSPGELYFWLGATFFLLPGAALLGFACEGPIVRAARALESRVRTATPHESLALVGLVGVVGFVISSIGNEAFILDLPLTDDEGAARFGGQVLASGHLMTRIPPMRFAFEDLFLYQRAGRWTSMDFPGALLPWAIGELTGTGSKIFRVFAAMAPLGVALAVRRRSTPAEAVVAGAIVLLSPMAATLSSTNHTFVVSRGALALGFGAVLFLDRPSFVRGALGGLAFGLAGLTRPAETVALVAPWIVLLGVRALRDRRDRTTLAGLVFGAAPMIVAFAVYDIATTGSIVPPRFAPNDVVHPYGGVFHAAFDFAAWPGRFGGNVSYNLLTLAVYFLGPLGGLLVAAGARESTEHRALVIGVVATFALALLHDDRGIHFVGPIHYSDTVVPLAIVAVAGLRRLGALAAAHSVDRHALGSAAAGYFLVGLPLFTAWQTAALAEHSLRLEHIVDSASATPRTPSVVLVPTIARVRAVTEAAEPLGSFVFTWPRPSPTLEEPVIFLLDSQPARDTVRAAFPRRHPFVLETRPGGYRLVSLDRSAPFRARE